MYKGCQNIHEIHQIHRGSSRRLGPPDLHVTVLRHCRCVDCRHWHDEQGYCDELLFRRYVPRKDYAPAMQPFWTDVGTIRPDLWHYCAAYHGPQASKDLWVWRYAKRKRPVPGGGRPGGGPELRLAGGNQPVAPDCRPDATGVKAQPNAQGRALTRRVGAGSNISADPAASTASARGRDRGEPGANGSFVADQAGARGGNSRHTDHSLFSEENAAWRHR